MKSTKKQSVLNNLPGPLQKLFHILKLPIWIIISYLLAQFIIILINTIFQNLLSNNIYRAIISTLSFLLLLFFVIFIPHKFFKKPLISREELGLKGLPTWTDIALAAIGFIAYAVLLTIIIRIFENFPFFDVTQEQPKVFNPNYLITGLDRSLALITICIIPPIIEEVIFRGWLYKKLRQRIHKHSMLFSILITSLFFGIMHFQWNIGASVFVMSVILCLARELTGTIYSGILIHIIVNTIAFFSVYIFQH